MKILITGRVIPHQDKNSTGQQLCDGFRQAGYDVYFYGSYHDGTGRILGQDIIADPDSFDLVIYTEMNDGMPQYDLLLNKFQCSKLYWDFDCSYNFPFALHRARMHNFDAYLVANYKYLDAWRYQFNNKPVLHLPYAFSAETHIELPDVKKQYLLGFVGTITHERKALFDKLECEVDIATGLYAEDLVTRTNTHYTVLHRNQDLCEGLVPMRPWETMGCGSCLLMDEVAYDDFIRYIHDPDAREGIFMYRNEEDIITWVNRYNNSQIGMEILEACGKRLAEYGRIKHTYRSRAESIVTWSKEIGLI